MDENTCPAGRELRKTTETYLSREGQPQVYYLHKNDSTPCSEGCKAQARSRAITDMDEGKRKDIEAQEKPKDAHSSVCACPSCVAESLEEKPKSLGEEIPQETIENFLWAVGRSRAEGSEFWTSMWHSNAYWRELADKFRSLQAENKELQSIKGILAVIHRDGGHHTENVGIKQSVEDGHKVWADLIGERDELQGQVGVLVVVAQPFADMADGKDAWKDEDGGCAIFPTLKSVRAIREVLSNLHEAARKDVERVKGLEVEITRVRGMICKGCANGWKRVPNGHIEPTPDKNYERSIPCKALHPKEES